MLRRLVCPVCRSWRTPREARNGWCATCGAHTGSADGALAKLRDTADAAAAGGEQHPSDVERP